MWAMAHTCEDECSVCRKINYGGTPRSTYIFTYVLVVDVRMCVDCALWSRLSRWTRLVPWSRAGRDRPRRAPDRRVRPPTVRPYLGENPECASGHMSGAVVDLVCTDQLS